MQKSLPYLWPKWRQNSQNRYPIYDQNGWKTLPFGAAHTYIAHIREYPPPREINLIWTMYTANSSLSVYCPDTGHGQLTSILSECVWPLLIQTNRISRRINKLSENLTSLSISTLNIKQFLWKYHILPTLLWAALILLRSKQRKY